MDHSLLLTNVIVLLGLLGISTLVYYICKKIKVPFAVGLLLSGLLLSFLSRYDHLAVLGSLEFSPDIVFYVFLPSLIFESSYHMNFQSFKGVMLEVLSLASIGLLVSLVVTAYLLHIWLHIPLEVCFLFGALISATDPVAVLAIFKEIKVPRRLSTILDGESLINDATALMMFQVFLAMVMAGASHQMSFGSMALEEGFLLVKVIVISLIVGGCLGIIFSYAIAKADSHKVQITLSLILAHSTFILSESFFHASGILSTLVAGIIVGNFGKSKLPVQRQLTLSEIWDFLGFLANALIFLLLGLRLGQVHFEAHWYMVVVAAGVTIVLARPLGVWLSFLLTNLWRSPSHRFCKKSQFIIAWGGMRGALAAAAVLLIPQTSAFAPVLQAMTAGVILITFVFNALTLRPILWHLGFGRYTPNEKIQRLESQLLVNQRVLGYLKYMLKAEYTTQKIYAATAAIYKARSKSLVHELKGLQDQEPDHERETEKILSQYALGIELRTYQKLFEYREIAEDRFRTLKASIYRQLERLESDILPDETSETSKIAPTVPEKTAKGLVGWILGYFYQDYKRYKILHRWQHYRARRIASWKVIRDFEVLYQEHEAFKGSSVVKKIITRYEAWHKNAQHKIGLLQHDHPRFVGTLQARFVERMCLRKEIDFERELFEKGLISNKVYQDVTQELKLKSEQL